MRPPGGLPTLTDLQAGAHVVSVPLRRRFRGVTHREAVLIQGSAGWGEFAPFGEYDDLESARWLAAAIEAAWTGWPAPLRDHIAVNATVPAVPTDDVPDVLSRYPGCTTAKVKVAEPGQTLADDVARVAAVRSVLGPAGLVRVDANGGWDVARALIALTALGEAGLEYAEQPCASLTELAELRRQLRAAGLAVPLAADESIRRAADPLRVAGLEAADLIVVKVAPLGGVRAALDVVAACGLPAVVSSAIDTSVGLAAGAALAAVLPDHRHACGLGTGGLLADDVTAHPLLPVDGVIAVRPVVPDPDRLTRLAVPADVEARWRDRLARCHAALAGGAA